MQSTYSLHIKTQPSRLMRLWINGLHALLMLAISTSAVNGIWQGLLLSLIAADWLREWRGLQRLEAKGICLRFNETQGWEVDYADQNDFHTVRIEPSSWSSSWGVILHIRDGKTVVRQMVFCDALTNEEFRRLRVVLRTRFNHGGLTLDI